MWRKPTDAKATSSNLPVAPPPAPSARPAALSEISKPAPVPAAPPTFTQPVTKAASPKDRSFASTFGSGLKIRGDVSGASDLCVDCEVQGKITLAESRVTVGPNGRVQGNIEALEIVVQGTVQGDLRARKSVQLGPSSRVQGGVFTPRIGVDDGAKLRIKVEMARPHDFAGPAKAGQAADSDAYEAVAVHSQGE